MFRLVCRSIAVALCLSAIPSHAQQEADVNRAAFWGTPTVDGGKCCQSLSEVRTNIDRIDKELVRLMAERGQYVHEAARFKKLPVFSWAREIPGIGVGLASRGKSGFEGRDNSGYIVVTAKFTDKAPAWF